MKKSYSALLIVMVVFMSQTSTAQGIEDELGAWYMYFWNTTISEKKFGFQGDVQYRNWNAMGDLEQLLLRGGVTFQPKESPVKFTLGYGNVTTGVYGVSKNSSAESRIYQEALISQKLGQRFHMQHRFRYEQRFVEGQDLRTRLRYNLFLNIVLKGEDLSQGAVYLALYNELFINGQRAIGNGNMVEVFDRNRAYIALGYSFTDNLRMQLGLMNQTTDLISKNQLQLSLHHKIARPSTEAEIKSN